MGFLFICNLRPAWHLQPAELCLEMQATAGQRANQSKTEKGKNKSSMRTRKLYNGI